jgi:hypothetical protein
MSESSTSTTTTESSSRSDALADLLDRLKRAEATCRRLHDTAYTAQERLRLSGKAQGIAVARSYVEEYLR